MLINKNSWWDETRDAGNYINSPILDPVSGFGGNGSSVDLCVVDGPFANSTVHLGPADSDTPAGFCLKRKVNEVFAAGAAQSVIDGCMNITDYANACIWCIGVSPHTAYVISALVRTWFLMALWQPFPSRRMEALSVERLCASKYRLS